MTNFKEKFEKRKSSKNKFVFFIFIVLINSKIIMSIIESQIKCCKIKVIFLKKKKKLKDTKKKKKLNSKVYSNFVFENM